MVRVIIKTNLRTPPKRCIKCRFSYYDSSIGIRKCIPLDLIASEEGKRDDCPVVKVEDLGI